MSWSLKVSHGDLDLSQASLGTVTGTAKLVQDLRCFILERMGTDDLHPSYGSLLDGGFRNGQYVEGVIGSANDEMSIVVVHSELRRIVAAYQAMQLARARQDLAIYGKATLAKGEVLLGLNNIEFTQRQDTLTVTLHITVGDGTSIPLSLDLST